MGNFLVYGKAGGAGPKIDRKLTSGMMPPVYTGSETRFGVVMGVGAEYAFSPAWSGKIEYDYVDLGRKSLTARDQFDNVSNLTISQNLHLIKLGLNYHLGASPGFADVSRVAAGALPQWGWTGLYGGVHVGAAFGGNEWISATGALQFAPNDGSFPGQGSTEGLLAGGQVGANAQFGGWVAGLELAASASDIDGYAKCAQSVVLPNPRSNVCHNKITSIGTVAGRLGQTWEPPDYGKAGAAWGKGKPATYPGLPRQRPTTRAPCAGGGWPASVSKTRSAAISAFVEYNHLDFGTRTANYVSQFGDPSSVAFNQRIDLVKVGLNYRLGWGAPMLEAQAADPALFPKASQLPAGWTIEAGVRHYGSTGRMQKDLYSPDVSGRLNSRLIYADQTAHAAETFFRSDHISGVFVKGSFGLEISSAAG